MSPVFDRTDTKPSTLADLLRWRALHESHREAYTFLLDGETKQVQMTYADLDREARRIAALLQDRTAVGDRVLLLYPPGLEYITAIFGCFYAGVVAVPAYPPRLNQSLARIQTIFQDARAPVALTTATILSSLRRTKALDPGDQPKDYNQALQWIATDTMDPQGDASYRESEVSPQALALLQYTSGSTASPKGVMLTHDNLIQNAALIEEAMSLTSQDRGVFWLPPYHDMGLMGGILQALYTGYPTTLMAPAAFLQHPLRWLQALSSWQATVSGAPNFAYDLCAKKATPETIRDLNLSSWTLAFTGAEPVRAETLSRFAETFVPCGFRHEAFYPCYGLAETTLFVSGGQRHKKPSIRAFNRDEIENGYAVETAGEQEFSRLLVACGSCTPGGHIRQRQEIIIVDPQTQTRCVPGTIGEIWVKGPNVALGYWDKEEETREAFQAFLQGDNQIGKQGQAAAPTGMGEGPFLRTGDLGFRFENELYVTGRLKDLIIIRGRNLYPQDIEQVVEKSHPLLRQDCCAAFAVEGQDTEQLVVVQEVSRHYDDVGVREAVEAIRQAVLSEFDVEVAAIELLRTGTIFKTSSGKIQRSACRRSFLAGELNAVYRWKRIQESTPEQRSKKEEMPPNLVGTGLAPVRESVAGTPFRTGTSPVPTRLTPTVSEIVDWLVQQISETKLIDAQLIDIRTPFVKFGLNSLEVVSLAGELEDWLKRSLPPTLLYDYPSIDALARYLAGEDAAVVTNAESVREAVDQQHTVSTGAIAIVGIGCRFPGANNPSAFWQMLHDGIDGISEVPTTRWNAAQFYAPDQATPGRMNTRWGGFLQDIEQFDPSFFAISPREAQVMDPQQRLLLEVAWETFEQAGIVPEKLAGSRTGIFVGISSSDYYALHHTNLDYHQAYTNTGNAHSIAANRLSYFFDFRGPSIAVDTSCSSSLVAVHQACLSVRNGECDLALAGGVNVLLKPEVTIAFSQARTMSSDGHCKTFDESADGYVRSEGCGLVLLKTLEAAKRDGDPILAIVRGSAVNQDGRSNGLTAPNGPSQEAIVRSALQNAGVSPNEISYVETHGSATPLGDPIEVESLKAVLMQERSPDQPCWLGAVKTNIGHLEAAAGIAGLIKTVLCLQKGMIAPNLHFKRLNPHISLAGTTFEIPTKPSPWSGSPHAQRFAGVSAFGFGGTNVHVILEGPPRVEPLAEETQTTNRGDSARPLSERSLHLLTISGRTAQALSVLAQRYTDFLATNPTDRREALSLRDLCYTANTERTHFAHRLAISASNTEEMREHLAAFIAGQPRAEVQIGYAEAGQRPIAFLFPGQGCQYVHMARQLYETQPTFRAVLDECDRILQPLLSQSVEEEQSRRDRAYPCPNEVTGERLGQGQALSLRSILYPADGAMSLIDETAYTQPALFALEYALAQMWLSWGIKPDVVMGHSMGEYVAACIAGLFSLEDGLKLITARGRLMQSLPEQGTIAVIFAEAKQIQPFLKNYEQFVSIAASNGPRHTVISGRTEIVHLIAQRLEAKNAARGMTPIKSVILTISQASHCPLVDPMLDAFEQVASSVTFLPLRIPLVCNLTGQLLSVGETLDAGYWRRHTREVVQFAAGVQTLSAHGCELFLELGPTPVLSKMGKYCLPTNKATWLSSLHQDHDDWQILLQSMASLYTKGCNPNWSGWNDDWTHQRRRDHLLALPTYPFEREYCWFKSEETTVGTGRGQATFPTIPVRKSVPATDSRTGASPVPTRGIGQENMEDWCFELQWVPQEEMVEDQPMTTLTGTWLIFADKKGIGEELALHLEAQGGRCIRVSAGEAYEQRHDLSFHIRPENAEDMQCLLETALRSDQCRGIVHLWSLDAPPTLETTGDSLQWTQVLGCGSTLHLVQKLIQQATPKPPLIWLVTQGAQPVKDDAKTLSVAQAPLWGFGRALACEYPSLWGGLVDLDPQDERASAALLCHTVCNSTREDQLAFRGGHRYVARLMRTRERFNQRDVPRLRPDSSYLITGGLGDLGLLVARWMVEQGARRLVLLGHTKLPPRNLWDQIEQGSRLASQISRIQELESLGASVYLASVDVTSEAQMHSFLEAFYDAGQPLIRGVVHTATKVRGGTVLNLDMAAFNTVLWPKMLGGWHLHHLFENTSLDFCVHFSSISSLLGQVGRGAANYAAANAFLDALAHYERATNHRAISINWGAWNQVGLAARTPGGLEHLAQFGVGSFSPRQGLEALGQILQLNLSQIAVVACNWQQFFQAEPGAIEVPLLSRLVEEVGGSLSNKDLERERSSKREAILFAKSAEREQLCQDYIRDQVARVLRLPLSRLDVMQPLIDLGLDSLMAIELKNKVELDLGMHIPIKIFLQGPSTARLAAQILALLTAEPLGTTAEMAMAVGTELAPVRLPTAAMVSPHQPLSHNQKALWFLSSLAPESVAYNVLYTTRIQQHLDVPALQRALLVLATRYPILTSVYTLQDSEPVQQTRADQTIPLEEHDASASSLDDLRLQLLEESNRPIDLTKGPVLRLILHQRADDDYVLGFIIHHIVADFRTLELLLNELSSLYTIEKMGQTEAAGADLWPQPAFQHDDYVRWQQSMLQSEAGEQHWQYWQHVLSGDLPVLSLPTDRPRPPVQTYKGASHRFTLSTDLVSKLYALALAEKVTHFTLMLSAYQVLLHRYSHQDDILVGTPALGRTHAAWEGVIGYIANPVIVRARIEQNLSFKELLQQTSQGVLSALEHQDFPFALLAERLQLRRDPSYSPITQTHFIWDSPRIHNGETLAHMCQGTGEAGQPPRTVPTTPALFLSPFVYGQQGSPFDLTLTVFEIEDVGAQDPHLRADFRYNTDLFDAATISRMAEHFLTLLGSIVDNPEQYVQEMTLLSAYDRYILTQGTEHMMEGNTVQCNDRQDPYVHQLFEQQVEQTPDAIAVVFEDVACGFTPHVTYRELNAQANHLASYLSQVGVGPQEFVGVCMDRSLEMVIALLGTLKAGGTYVPLDPNYPQERLTYMLEDAQVSVVLIQARRDSALRLSDGYTLRLPTTGNLVMALKTERTHGDHWSGATPIGTNLMGDGRQGQAQPLQCETVLGMDERLIDVEADGPPPVSTDTNPVNRLTPENLIYVIYTSGSTGRPKGIGVSHRSLINLLNWFGNAFHITAQDRALIVTSFSFDLTQKDLFAPLLVGGAVHLQATGYDIALVRQSIAEQKITLLNCTPSMFYPLVDDSRNDAFEFLTSLRCVFLGGEPIALPQLWTWMHAPQCHAEIVNTYGPTECTDVVAFSRIKQYAQCVEAVVPIGRPIWNTQLLVLDENLQLVPPLVVGELYVAGTCVGTGYVHDAALTAAKFLPNPFVGTTQTCNGDGLGHQTEARSYSASASRLYKTGDLARYRPDGTIEYLGRIDHQVKLRGYRIELGEIEATLRAYPGVQEAVVVLREKDEKDKYLRAYVAMQHNNLPHLREELQSHLRKQLPDYMVPTSVVELVSLPLSPNGKVDRSALAAMDVAEESHQVKELASTPLQELLATIWKDVLRLREVGIHENFFELGGHSLSASQVVARIRQTMQVDLPLRNFFEEPTIAQLSQRLFELMRGEPSFPVPALVPMERPVDLPLSFAQERLWFLHQWEPNSPWYNIATTLRLSGRLSLAALERSLARVVQRHEVLHTTFEERLGRPVQIIAPCGTSPQATVQVPVIDLHGIAATKQDQLVTQLARAEAQRPFDLTNGPLLRVCLLRLDAQEALGTGLPPVSQEHVLLFTLHHIVTDAWSLGVLVHEVTTYYQAEMKGELLGQTQADRGRRDTDRGKPLSVSLQVSTLPELPIQYADYAIFQRQFLQGLVREQQLDYWRTQLAGLSPLDLPTDHPRPAVQTSQGAIQALLLPLSLLEHLHALSQREGVTLFMLTLSAFQLLLARYSGQSDIAVGTTTANRTSPELEVLIGCFFNTLVLRSDLSGNPPFRQFLQQVRKSCLDAYAHATLPFEQVVEELQPVRDLSRNALFQVLFELDQITPSGESFSSDISVQEVASTFEPAKVDLALRVVPTPQGLVCRITFRTDLFEPETIDRILHHYQTVLEAIVHNPDQLLRDLPLLTPAELHELLVTRNQTQADYPRDLCFHQLFEAQAGRTPDAIAATYQEQHLTYQELDRHSNQLACFLAQQGVGPDMCVGICMQRSLDLLIGLLGILKAGGAFLPLDPAFPQERMAFMLADAQACLLLTQQSLVSRLPQTETTPIFCLDTGWQQLHAYPTTQRPALVTAEHLAYIIYTSGSTGKPKGVLIHHRGFLNYLVWCAEAYGATHGRGAPVQSTIAADAIFPSLFAPLLVGRTVTLLEESHALSALAQAFLELGHFSLVKITPSQLETLTPQLPQADANAYVCTLVIGAEALRGEILTHWQTYAPEVILLNEYGPTETVVGCSIYRIPAGKRISGAVPIGLPSANMQFYVLDRHLQPVPIGVPGELFIGGDGLAWGYSSRPDITANTFIPHPFVGTGTSPVQPGARLYRTGDVVRYLPDRSGNIEFLGRIDHQVKILGYRIELGEIEAQLMEHPAVQDCIVMAREEKRGETRLVAYVIVSELQASLPSTLRNSLKEKLPEYMVPAAIVELVKWPLTTNGKVDRGALPMPEIGEREETFVAARTEIEQVLGGIWEDVLGLEQVSIHDDFFELGGHSLRATQVVARVRQAMQVELPLRSLFEAPTIAQLSAHLEELMRGSSSPLVPPVGQAQGRREARLLQPMERPIDLPLSFAQERLWFLHQWDQASSWYNVPIALRLSGQLDVSALERSLATVVQRHEVLRTTFEQRSGRPVQVIAPYGASPQATIQIRVIDLRGWGDQQLSELQRSEAQHPFSLTLGPLLRMSLLRLDEQEHILLFTLHHIVCDGWSMGVLVREINLLYQAQIEGEPASACRSLPELPIQYADYALWQRQWLQGEVLDAQLAYWRKQLADLSKLSLPTDHPRPAVKTNRGANQSRLLPKAISDDLLHLCQKFDVTLFMLGLSAFQVLLMCYTGQTDISVGTPVANRTWPELEGMIGFFVNTLVLHTDLGGNPTFLEVLRRVREVCLGAYMNQDIPFEKLVEELALERDTSRSPLFQVMFTLQKKGTGPLPTEQQDLAGVRAMPLEYMGITSKFDLALSLTETEQGLHCRLEYSTDLFEAETITRWLESFQTLLQGIAQNPQTRLANLPLLTEAECHRLLVEWNATQTDFSLDVCVDQFIEQQVEQTPDTIALAIGSEELLTYEELNRRANQLAHYLQKLGVGPDRLVGLCMERCSEMVVALLAVLKAGGAYVPLDPTYPQTRLAFLLADAQPLLLLTMQQIQENVLLFFEGKVFCLDRDWELIQGEPTENLDTCSDGVGHTCRRDPTNLAYLIYTSGSTGRPKGVLVEHRQLFNYTWAMIHQLGLLRDRTFALLQPLTVDSSVTVIFSALSTGGCLQIISREQALDPQAMQDLFKRFPIDCLKIAPSHLAALHASSEPEQIMPQSHLILGGEASRWEWSESLSHLSGSCTVINHYGPTETTVGVLTYQLEQGSVRGASLSTPLGYPIGNTQAYVLDAQMQPLPIGVWGELYIAGLALARGYLRRPDLTAERFLPNPFVGGEQTCGARLYRTGDLVRYRADGAIEYLGRMDQQVKLRGYRIELGEIEAMLREHPEIQDVVVLVREDVPGNTYLVAYLVKGREQPVTQDAQATANDLHFYLQDHLPSYMIPQAFVFLDALPLTPHGKLDLNAFPLPEATRPHHTSDFVSPRTSIETTLATIWSQVLTGVAQVGIHDNFFELGGHSLLATQLLTRVHAIFQVEVPLSRLFETPTIAEMALAIEQIQSKQIAQSTNEELASMLTELGGLSADEVQAIFTE